MRAHGLEGAGGREAALRGALNETTGTLLANGGGVRSGGGGSSGGLLVAGLDELQLGDDGIVAELDADGGEVRLLGLCGGVRLGAG